ncbi:MAG: MerR family transcriptional regulator [Bryobacterales bacterium]|nr:MerR family transcriptional regulator [Bryobacterales bacterium]
MPRRKEPKPAGLSDNAVAILLGVSRRTLNRWLEKGKLSPPEGRLAKNRRLWTLQDVDYARIQLEEAESKRAT